LAAVSSGVQKLIETLRLIRFVNCVLAMVGVALGAHLVVAEPSYYGPMMAAWCAFLVCAAGNIVNDLVDTDIDRINRPQRVLVREALSRRYALVTAAVLSLVAMGIAFTVSWEVTAAGLTAIGLLMAYNFRLKGVPFLGNTVIALLGGMTFITGGLAVDVAGSFRLPGPLIPAVFAFLFHLVREIIKDVQDLEGDRELGVITLPQLIGVRSALRLALALFLVLVAATVVPIVAGWYTGWYGLIAIFIIDLPLTILLLLICLNPSDRRLQIGSTALKVGMVVGVVALAAA
jgi:geranylgeranylglycerol-phosphate geranylgeranyltransferase